MRSRRSPSPRSKRKIGARGLRMIIEELMLDLMYTSLAEEGTRVPDHARGGRGEGQADYVDREGRIG